MKKNTGLYLDQEVIARARGVVTALRGTPYDVGTLSTLVGALLEAKVNELEQEHNDGHPFPSVEALPRGSVRTTG